MKNTTNLTTQEQNEVINSKYTFEEGYEFRNDMTTEGFCNLEIIPNQNWDNYSELFEKLNDMCILTNICQFEIHLEFKEAYEHEYFELYVCGIDSIVCDHTEDMLEWSTDVINAKIKYLRTLIVNN